MSMIETNNQVVATLIAHALVDVDYIPPEKDSLNVAEMCETCVAAIINTMWQFYRNDVEINPSDVRSCGLEKAYKTALMYIFDNHLSDSTESYVREILKEKR